MAEFSEIKNKLLEELWTPYAKEGGKLLYPRRRNKRMKCLTLANDNEEDFQTIGNLEANNVTSGEFITIWTHSMVKQLRLETVFSSSEIIGAKKFEDAILGRNFPLGGNFPFDFINLDFSSQDPAYERGRVEKEIICLEETIRLQRGSSTSNKSYVMIYTTILNSNELEYDRIMKESNKFIMAGWQGLQIDECSEKINIQKEKIDCIERILGEIFSKYGHKCKMETLHFPLNGKHLFSIACILT